MNARVQLMSQSAYARRRGVAKSAVSKAIAENRITTVNGQIDPEVADIQWAKNTRARADSGSRPADLLGVDGSSAHATVNTPEPGYSDSRARREKADAERAELETAKMAGRLVQSDKVQTAVFDAFRQLRDRLMTVPRRCAPAVLGFTEVRDIEMIMADEMRLALEAFESQTLENLKPKAAE